jgi:hypothetical protein
VHMAQQQREQYMLSEALQCHNFLLQKTLPTVH